MLSASVSHITIYHGITSVPSPRLSNFDALSSVSCRNKNCIVFVRNTINDERAAKKKFITITQANFCSNRVYNDGHY